MSALRIFMAGMLWHPVAADAREGDRLIYSVGGTMSAGFSLTIDLKNGNFSQAEAAGLGADVLDRTKKGRLDKHRLKGLKNRVVLALKSGLESDLCKQQRLEAERTGKVPLPNPGSIDYIPRLQVVLGSSSADLFGSQCWGTTAKALSSAAYEATRLGNK